MKKEFIANLSGGKDSMALVDGLIEEGRPLTKVINYDTGMEFQAVYRNIEKISEKVKAYGLKWSI